MKRLFGRLRQHVPLLKRATPINWCQVRSGGVSSVVSIANIFKWSKNLKFLCEISSCLKVVYCLKNFWKRFSDQIKYVMYGLFPIQRLTVPMYMHIVDTKRYSRCIAFIAVKNLLQNSFYNMISFFLKWKAYLYT